MPDWPHAPVHRLTVGGTFIVSCGTYQKLHHFRDRDRLEFLHDSLLSIAAEFDWGLQAWAVFSNHYHIIGNSPENAKTLKTMIGKLHTTTAIYVNKLDGTPGRQVWFQFRDTALTYERSCLARLNYVHNNPVHHGLVVDASQYRWCSASWFERTADPAFLKTVRSFKTDRLNVPDDYQF